MPAIVKHLEDIPGFRNAYEKAFQLAMKEAVSFAVGTTPFVVTISKKLARIFEETHNVELLVIEEGWQPITQHRDFIFNKNFERVPQYNDNFSFNAVRFKDEKDLTMFILKWS